MTIAQILRKAARVLRQRGWCRDGFTKNGRVCALGAINVAAGLPANSWDTCFKKSPSGRAADRLRRSLGCLQISAWNDDPRRTQKQVIAALTRAAGPLQRIEPAASGKE